MFVDFFSTKHITFIIVVKGKADQYIILLFFPLWRCDPTRVMASSFLMFLDHTQRRTTVSRTSLDE